MFTSKSSAQPNVHADHAALSVDQAIKATQRAANEALDSLAVTVQDYRHQATPLLRRANDRAIALARRGVDAVRGGSRQLRSAAIRTSDHTLDYVKDEPVKAMLIAAAAGAALVALVGFVTRER